MNTKNEIINNVKLVNREGSAIELRILNTEAGVKSGYFDDLEAFADAIIENDKKYAALYVTLNPISSSDSQTVNNALSSRCTKTTSDNEIAKRIWLPIDIDPKRPSNTSSSDEEHQGAIQLAQEIRKFLEEEGWSEPIIASSGNGAHVLIPIDLPNTMESHQLVKDVLGVLHEKFATEELDVDRSVSNASRIWKVYGSTACKGTDTVDRPHRKACIISEPPEVQLTTYQQLQAFVAEYAEKKKAAPIPNINTENSVKFDIDDFIKRNNLKISHTKSNPDGSNVIVLSECPWNPNHSVPDRGAYIKQFASGALVAGCHHASCKDENWKTLRAKYKKTESNNASVPKKDLLRDEVEKNVFEYFLSKYDEPYIWIKSDKVCEYYLIGSPEFKHYVNNVSMRKFEKLPTNSDLDTLIAYLRYYAKNSEKIYDLKLRVNMYENAIYFDLANAKNEVVKIANGKATIELMPVPLFIRNSNMASQVIPNFNGDLKKIYKYMNFSKRNRLLFITIIVSLLVPDIQRPLLLIHGEKGAAKSSLIEMVKKLFDPTKNEALVSLSSKSEDVALLLTSNFLVAIDNVSRVNQTISDMFCQAVTGGALPKRKLFSDQEIVYTNFEGNVCMSSIEVVFHREDILDRTILVESERIDDSMRKSAMELKRSFEEDKAEILGAIFVLLAKALEIRNQSMTMEPVPHRLIDFANFALIIAQLLGETREEFTEALLMNKQKITMASIENNATAYALYYFMEDKDLWQGSAESLFKELTSTATRRGLNGAHSNFAKGSNRVKPQLSLVESNLKSLGIEFSVKNAGLHKQYTVTNSNVTSLVS